MNEVKNLYAFGGFRFDAKNNILWRDEKIISLSPKALELLKLLIEKQGEVVSKQEIFDKVWADTFVEEGVLTQNIYTLRQALGTDENGKQLIENIARKGYRLSVVVICEGEKARRKDDEKERLSDNIRIENTQNFISPSRGRFVSSSIIFALIFIVIVYISYRYFFSNSSETAKNQTSELKFKQLTDTGDVSYLTISPSGNSVAYTLGFDVYLRNLKTKSEVKINIENQEKAGCLQFSADEKFIYFNNFSKRDENGKILRVKPTDGKIEEIVDDVWSGFSVSPNGKTIAFVRKIPNENKQNLVIKNLETNIEKTIKSINLPEEFYWNNYPAWSSDGKKIAMVAVTQTEHFSRLLLIDTENLSQQELKPNNFRNIEQIVWNELGNSLIISASDDKNFQLWKLSIADGNVKRITNDLNSYLGISISNDRKRLVSRQRVYFSNIWISNKNDLNNLKQLTNGSSRNDGLNGLTWIDDEKIIYTSNDEKIRDWNLWLINSVDGSKQKLTDTPGKQNDYPTVSFDKKTIYFASDRNKESRIWRITTDGSNPQQITFGEDETHHFPQISPDGKWLYFIIKSGRNSTIGRKSLEENSTQELSGKTHFVPGNFLTLSPDGKFLAFQNIAKDISKNIKFQLAIMSAENPANVEFTEVDAWQQKIEWSKDAGFFDFVTGNVKQTAIMRHSTAKVAQPSQILDPTETTIFNFAWSPNGENLAVSRGQLLRDVVLLSNFE